MDNRQENTNEKQFIDLLKELNSEEENPLEINFDSQLEKFSYFMTTGNDIKEKEGDDVISDISEEIE